ncbi:hypothetical protein D081_0240 [Anaerovibrio sp. JC8]|uniref:glucosamine inositolphosphorylceramide transferase family protein n=1 Tax=Anaerovibrio sp. JC8 TaxID=1240085 RepID=UPI000A0E55FF|nr:hypothetical protein [Anaerovibrio sp. JC8]ORU01421.1 hypothetical protein D081_0240 [Anaerovibrio sp. JC8]
MKLINILKNAYHGAIISYKVGYRYNGEDEFVIIPNPCGEWCADPFVIEFDSKIFIFAEAYNAFSGRGKIKYCVLEDGLSIKWKNAIEESYHLSYPFIWQDKSGIHICPESCSINDIHRYDCVRFPDKWEKKSVLLEGKKYADSTFFFHEDGRPEYCFTHEVTGPMRGNLFRYRFKKDGIIDKKTEEFITDDPMICRPGGKFFMKNGKTYRVAQDGFEDYGKRLIFLEVLNMEPYQEVMVGEISYKEHTYVENCIGMHTYNVTDQVEVVDFRIKQLSYLRLFCNFVHVGWRIIKEIIKKLLGR